MIEHDSDRRPILAALPRTSIILLACALFSIACSANPIFAQSTESPDAAKQKIFASEAWQQAMKGLNDWFSVQVIYPQSEVPKLKDEIVAECNDMTAAQLANWLSDLQQKLAIEKSPEAVEMRQYIGYNLSVASDAYAAKIRSTLPDVLNMTPAQVKQALYNLQQQRAATVANEAAFDQQRKTQLHLIQQMNQQTANAINSANRSMSSFGPEPGFVPIQQVPKPVYNPQPIIFGYPWNYGGWGRW